MSCCRRIAALCLRSTLGKFGQWSLLKIDSYMLTLLISLYCFSLGFSNLICLWFCVSVCITYYNIEEAMGRSKQTISGPLTRSKMAGPCRMKA